jgi:hypothetical protein
MSDASRPGEATPRVVLAPLEDTSTFADRAYTALERHHRFAQRL